MNIKQLIKNESGFQCFQAELMILIIVLGIVAAIAIPQFAAYRNNRAYDSDVKASLKNAATAEETYYKDKGKYTAKIDRLPGFNQSANVTITVEATTTTFIITGTATERCEPNTGTWFISSTTGKITGTPCR